jgi:hypothetical protein
LTWGWWQSWWRSWRLRLVSGGGGRSLQMRERTLWWPLLIWGGQLTACGGDGGGQVDGESVGGWRSRWREKIAVEAKPGGDWFFFLSTLDLIFSFLRPWNPPLFIKGGRWIFCLK